MKSSTQCGTYIKVVYFHKINSRHDLVCSIISTYPNRRLNSILMDNSHMGYSRRDLADAYTPQYTPLNSMLMDNNNWATFEVDPWCWSKMPLDILQWLVTYSHQHSYCCQSPPVQRLSVIHLLFQSRLIKASSSNVGLTQVVIHSLPVFLCYQCPTIPSGCT